jgi:peroxiredoxin
VRTWIALLIASTAACTAVEAPGDRAATAVRAAEPPAAPAIAVATLPRIPLVSLDGQPTRLDQLAAGKPALVSFWATWCDACAAELAALNRLHDRATASGALVIGVDVGEPRDKASAFVREHGLAYAQLVDEKMELADALGQKRLPATLVLDRQGRVVFVGAALDEKALAAFRAAMEH